MRKQNAMTEKSAKAKTKNALLRKISTQKPPTADEIAKAIAMKNPSITDIGKIQSLVMDNSPEIHQPIVLSDTWYEFSVFVSKFHMSASTANAWLNNGWLAYSEIGRFRFINKSDIEAMMIHFRRPAKWATYLLMLLSYSIDFGSDLVAAVA